MKSLIHLLFLLFYVLSFGQEQNILWQRVVSRDSINKVNDVTSTSDGGFIIGGNRQKQFESYTSNYNTDIYIIKLDYNGEIIWEKTIGDENRNLLKSINRTNDSGYIVGAWDKSRDTIQRNNGQLHIRDLYKILKVDSKGEIEFEKTFSGTKDDFIFSVKQTSDNGYIIGGHSNSKAGKDMVKSVEWGKDWWVFKLDKDLNIEWQHTIGGGRSEYLSEVIETKDKGFLFTGYSDSKGGSYDKYPNENNQNDFFIVKTDAKGVFKWVKMYGGARDDQLRKVIETKDGGFLLGGVSNSSIGEHKKARLKGSKDIWLVKIDESGMFEWDRSLGGIGVDELGSIQEVSNGDLLIGGSIEVDFRLCEDGSYRGNREYYVVKLNEVGIEKWSKKIGGKNNDFLTSALEHHSNELFLAGTSYSFLSEGRKKGKFNRDIWLLNVDVTKENSLSNDIKVNALKSKIIFKSRIHKITSIEFYTKEGTFISKIDGTNKRFLTLKKNLISEKSKYLRLISGNTAVILDQDILIQ